MKGSIHICKSKDSLPWVDIWLTYPHFYVNRRESMDVFSLPVSGIDLSTKLSWSRDEDFIGITFMVLGFGFIYRKQTGY